MKPSFYHNKALTTAQIDDGRAAPDELQWETAYPRPSLRRDDGTWKLLTDWTLTCVREDDDRHTPLGPIRMPFPPEAPLSGIGQTLEAGEVWLYETTFTLDAPFIRRRTVLLHLPPTDQMCIVTLNGHEMTEDITAVLPSEYWIDEYLHPGENHLTLRVRDGLNPDIPYGKQSAKRGGMWYTPTSGMHGMPWLESVPDDFIEELDVKPTKDSVTIMISGCEELPKRLTWESEEGSHSLQFYGDSVTLHIPNPHLWSPDDPYVYRYTIEAGNDRVSSYFALRTVTRKTVNGRAVLCLNGKPHYFHGLLDQGYFPDGIDLPPRPDDYRAGILAAKSLGFDTLRKHIRVDDPYFYYYCDLCGMLVFQDFVNSGHYSFLRDTVLPTIGFRRSIRRGLRHDIPVKQCLNFLQIADDTLRHLRPHPCVVYYTIFNEGWGQHNADILYHRYRKGDPSRIWDTTSGWFFSQESDVQSEHVYFRRLQLRQKMPAKRPLVLSEFGGYACKIDGHVFNTEKSYGYKTLSSPAALTEALEKLYRDEVLPMIDRGLCVTIYTQITDVEDEINGLFTYDRQVCKVDAEVMRKIAEDLRTAFIRTWSNV